MHKCLPESLPANAAEISKQFPKIDNADATEFSCSEIETAVTLKVAVPDSTSMRVLKDNELTKAPTQPTWKDPSQYR